MTTNKRNSTDKIILFGHFELHLCTYKTVQKKHYRSALTDSRPDTLTTALTKVPFSYNPQSTLPGNLNSNLNNPTSLCLDWFSGRSKAAWSCPHRGWRRPPCSCSHTGFLPPRGFAIVWNLRPMWSCWRLPSLPVSTGPSLFSWSANSADLFFGYFLSTRNAYKT